MYILIAFLSTIVKLQRTIASTESVCFRLDAKVWMFLTFVNRELLNKKILQRIVVKLNLVINNYYLCAFLGYGL